MISRLKLMGATALVGLTAAGFGAPALAQQQASKPAAQSLPTTSADDEEEGKEGEVEALVVTGSRIKRSEYNSALPVQVITSDQASLAGLVDTSEILQSSSVTGGAFQVNNSLTGYVVTGGPGVNTISLRGLGATRTLVLFNGRRLPPAGVRGTVGPVDLNTIPSSLIERVEILKDGASSIYGSDAVAGVVNYITQTNLDGAKLTFNANMPFQSGGEQYSIDGAWGKTFDRGYITIAGNYYEQVALRRGDREDTQCAADYLVDPDTGARIDYSEYDGSGYKCYNQINNVLYGSSYGYLQYLKDGVTYPTTGNNSPFADMARQGRANYPATYTYANYDTPYWDRSTIISPVERASLYVAGGFDITPQISAYGEALYNNRSSEQDSTRQLFPTLSSTNPNNKFYQNGISGGSTVYPVISIPYDSKQDVDYYRVLGGLKGELGGWSWDIYGQYGLSSGDYSISSVYADRVYATTAYSTACNQSAITISGGDCSTLPSDGIPWSSTRILSGQFTDAEKAFLFGVDTGHTDYKQYTVEATVSGDLFTLPAGPVGAAFGVTYRHDELDDQPGRESVNSNNWGLTAAGHTEGSYETKEIYGEFSVPLLKGLPGIELFDLSLSGRYTDVSSYGSDSTYKVGLNWQINDWLRLRGTKGTSFRAPALYELYLANQTSYIGQTSIDPCINWGDSTNARIQANCAAAGLASDWAGYGSSALVVAGGGAGVLKAETSDASTIGVIFTPQFADLNIAVDYFDILVNNEIDQFGAGNILYQCYNATTTGSSPFCSLFERDSTTGQITTVYNSYVNVAEQRNRGIDLSVTYRHEFDVGNLTLNAQFTWQLQDTTRVLGDDEEDYNGSTYNYRGPDFLGNTTLTWRTGDWTVNWATQYIGKGSNTEIYGADVYASTKYASSSNYDYQVGSTYYNYVYYKQYTEFQTYHSVSVRKVIDDTTVTVGLQNVFDEDPPSVSAGEFRVGTSALNTYDLRGRRAFITVQKRW